MKISDYPPMNENLFAPTGWICPKCGRVFSPTTPFCYFCGKNDNITYTVSTGDTPETMKQQKTTTGGK